MDSKQRLALAGVSFPLIEAGMALTHQGAIGLIVGGAITYGIYKFTEGTGGEGDTSPSGSPSDDLQGQPGEPSLLRRLWEGKRAYAEASDGDEQQAASLLAPPRNGQDGPWIPPQFLLDDVMDVMHAFNKQGSVYFGNSEEGAIAIALNAMYHVIDISSSGKGKSNRFRLAMMQMVNHCETYYINPLAASVKAVTDEREIEVWKPIYDRLANQRPIKDGTEIKHLLSSLTEEIARRNEQEDEGDFSWQDRPVFVFIDELPEVFARSPEAVKHLDKIGRLGRQFCVFLWLASQTAQVNDIGLSTAAQAQFKTRIYGGGDKTSSDRVMKGSLPKDTERTLQSNGAGLTLMLADGMGASLFVRAPLVTNEALFDYLRLPAFRKEDWISRGTRKQTTQTTSSDRLSFSLERPPSPMFPARDETVKVPDYENEREMKEPLKRHERDESLTEKDETFTPSHEDEIAVLMAVLQLQQEGVNVTREAIKQRLGWNNAKHAVVKFVCDKHKIAVR